MRMVGLYISIIYHLLFNTRVNPSTRSSKLWSDINGDSRGSRISEERIFDSISGSISTAPVCRSEKGTTSNTTTRGTRNTGQRSGVSTASAVSQAIVRVRGDVGDRKPIKHIDTGYFSSTRSSTRDEASPQGVRFGWHRYTIWHGLTFFKAIAEVLICIFLHSELHYRWNWK